MVDIPEITNAVVSLLQQGQVVHETAPGHQPGQVFLRSSLDYGVLQISDCSGAPALVIASAVRADVALTTEARRLVDGWNVRLPLRSICIVEQASPPTGPPLATLFMRAWVPPMLLGDNLWAGGGQMVKDLIATTMYAPSEVAGGAQSQGQLVDGCHIDINQIGGRACTFADVSLIASHLGVPWELLAETNIGHGS